MMPDRLIILATCFELALMLGGLVLFWRLVLSPSARSRLPPPKLPRWDVPGSVFMILLALVLCGMAAAGALSAILLKNFPLTGDARTVFQGASVQIGMLVGILIFRLGFDRTPAATTPAGVSVLTSGAATFLIALPILMAVSNAWELFLELYDLPAERQDLIRMFAHADSALLLASMIVLATVFAPVTEELVFRAGFFRFFRARLPAPLALGLPAVIFASLHVNWSTLEGFASFLPLLVLAVVFSLAYERTGRIGTAIVAHALFNLNTVVLIFCGVGLET